MTGQIVPPDVLQQLSNRVPNQAKNASLAAVIPFLNVLAGSERQLLEEIISERYCKPGEIILKEGERGDAIFIIWSGQVVVVKDAIETLTVLGWHHTGEIIGEMALLANQPRSATVIALEETRLLSLDREVFQSLLRTNPEVGRTLLDVLSKRLNASNEARTEDTVLERHLENSLSSLQNERERLLELQRLRQETFDLIVHDLRNPLSSIYTALKMLQALLPVDTEADSRELLEIATINCDRMTRLVNGLLDVTHIESGTTSYHFAEINLAHLLKEALDQLSLVAARHNVTIRAQIPEGIPPLSLDAEKIERVIINLLDNALKYTDPGGVITVGLEDRGQQVAVSVMDHGPGIPPEDRLRIFERFTQVSSQIVKARGFGLGLVFCRLAVEGHGGKIWVEDGADGVGSRFVFTLPLHQDREIKKL